MRDFYLGALSDWHTVRPSDPAIYKVDNGGYRSVRFDVISSAHVVIEAINDDGVSVLVGAGQGQFEVKFNTSETVSVVFRAADDCIISVRGFARSQVVPESDEVTFTTIEPRRSRPDDEYQRIIKMIQLQSARREKLLLDEMRSLRDARSGANDDSGVIEPVEGGAVDVEPSAPAPAPETLDGEGGAENGAS